MELTSLMLYLIITISSVGGSLLFIGVLGGIVCAVAIILYLFTGAPENEDVHEKVKFFTKYSVPIAITLLLVSAIIPTKKDMMIIFGVPYALDKGIEFSNSEMGEKGQKVIMKMMDDYLQEENKE